MVPSCSALTGELRGRQVRPSDGRADSRGRTSWTDTQATPSRGDVGAEPPRGPGKTCARATYHPDFHRRSWNFTRSPDCWLQTGRGLSPPVRSCTDPGARSAQSAMTAENCYTTDDWGVEEVPNGRRAKPKSRPEAAGPPT